MARSEAFTTDPAFWLSIVHPDDQERTRAEIARTDETGAPYRIEHRYLTRDGQVIWVRNDATLISDDAGQPLFWQGVVSDITEQKRHEQELTRRAARDPLTGLPNRTLLNDRLSEVLRLSAQTGKCVALLYLDLDDFKGINDGYGHPIGDQVLMEVARRLLTVVREVDTVVRIGGDEFVILLPAVTHVIDAVHAAERIIETITEPILISGHNVTTAASVGIVLGQSPEDRLEQLLAQADRAMYAAKAGGKRHYAIFEPAVS